MLIVFYSAYSAVMNTNLYTWWISEFTATFNNMRTQKLKAQPKNAFSATVNQVFSSSSQLPTTTEHCFVVWIVHNDLNTTRSAVVGSWEEPPNIWLTVAKNSFVDWALNLRVRMLLKGTVNIVLITHSSGIYLYSERDCKRVGSSRHYYDGGA